MAEKVQIFVNEETFGQRNLMTITGRIEVSLSNQNNYFATELIYLSFTDTYDTNSTQTMQLKGMDVYNLMCGLEEVLIKKSSSFRKFTDSSKSKNTEQNIRKALMINCEKEKVYINLNVSSAATNNAFKPLCSVAFEIYEVNGVVKTLEAFMNEYKQNFYKTQRAYEKMNKKNKSGGNH